MSRSAGGASGAGGAGGSQPNGGASGTGGRSVAVPQPVNLCNGSDDLVLILRAVGGYTNGPVGEGFVFPNGSPFIFIDGSCRFWRMDLDFTGGVVTGQLDGTTVATIEELLFGFNLLAGTHINPRFCDGGDQEMYVAGMLAVARDGCGGEAPGDPERAMEIREIAWDLWRAVAEEGEPSAGPVRYQLEVGEPTQAAGCWDGNSVVMSWTLDDAAALLVTTPNGPGRIVEGELAAQLRQLAKDFRVQDPFGCDLIVPVGDMGVTYLLLVRDALPFENNAGTVVIPPT